MPIKARSPEPNPGVLSGQQDPGSWAIICGFPGCTLAGSRTWKWSRDSNSGVPIEDTTSHAATLIVVPNSNHWTFLFIYFLFIQKDRITEREKNLPLPDHSPDGPNGQSWTDLKLGTRSIFWMPPWVQGLGPGPSSAMSPGYQQWVGSEVGQLGLETMPTGDISTSGRGLNCYAIVPTPGNLSFNPIFHFFEVPLYIYIWINLIESFHNVYIYLNTIL